MSFEQGKIFKLKGKVQHYAWGGFDFIPAWLGIDNSAQKPHAEYWIGAHPSASSVLVNDDGEMVLYDAIKQNPATYIGSKVFEAFGELPYLFKILDVKDMLSIQVHPSKTEAAIGYEAEEAAGVLLSAPHRNYKDRNHKPEVMVALSEFWLLHGFLEKDALLDVLRTTPEFAGFDDVFNLEGYKGLYQYVMQMPQDEVNELLAPLVQRAIEAKQNNTILKHQPGWWVAKLFDGQTSVAGDIDRGVFSIYFFNIVKAQPGEAIFQGAGIPHAYLEGQNVELMANSDNVLRGGLTPKHVDVPELLKHTIFEGTVVNIMAGEKRAAGEVVYNCPVPDFGISKLALTAGDEVQGTASSLEILVIMEGSLHLTGTKTVSACKGEAVAILPGESYIVTTASNVLAYKAFVP